MRPLFGFDVDTRGSLKGYSKLTFLGGSVKTADGSLTQEFFRTNQETHEMSRSPHLVFGESRLDRWACLVWDLVPF